MRIVDSSERIVVPSSLGSQDVKLFRGCIDGTTFEACPSLPSKNFRILPLGCGHWT